MVRGAILRHRQGITVLAIQVRVGGQAEDVRIPCLVVVVRLETLAMKLESLEVQMGVGVRLQVHSG